MTLAAGFKEHEEYIGYLTKPSLWRNFILLPWNRVNHVLIWQEERFSLFDSCFLTPYLKTCDFLSGHRCVHLHAGVTHVQSFLQP